MKAYFNLQLTRITRGFTDHGIAPVLGYLLLIVGYFGLSNYLFTKTSYAPYGYVIVALLLIARLSDLQRTEFIQLCFGKTRMKQIRLIENGSAALPFSLFLLYKQQPIFAAGLLCGAVLLALFRFPTLVRVVLWTPFSKRPYEFPQGFRKTYGLLLVIYAITAMGILVNNLNLSVVMIVIVYGLTSSFYTKNEPKYFVWVHKKSASAFLLDKLKTAVLFASTLALPVLVALFLVYPTNALFIVLFLVIGICLLVTLILAKYADYPDEMRIAHAFLLAVAIFLPPLFLGLIPYFYLKALKQLKPLLS